MTAVKEPSALVTGAAAFVTVSALAPGAAGLATEPGADAAAPVIGARGFVTVDTTGAATLVTGARA